MKKQMRKLIVIFFVPALVHAGERIPFRDTTDCIVATWKQQPAVPLPTLDHHLGKITASIGAYSVMSLAGVKQTTAGIIVSGAALTFEAIQVLFFDETPRHALNDMVLFSYHWSAHLMLEREYIGGASLTINLTALYLFLLPCE
jgi:hypothetical protein